MSEPAKKLTPEEIRKNAEIADAQADSTKDGGKRPAAWNPPLIDPEEHKDENPYSR